MYSNNITQHNELVNLIRLPDPDEELTIEEMEYWMSVVDEYTDIDLWDLDNPILEVNL